MGADLPPKEPQERQYASSLFLRLGRPLPGSLSTFYMGRANGRGVPGPTLPCPVHDPACSPPSTPDPPGQKALLTHTLSKSQQVGRSSSACGQAFARFPGRQRHVLSGKECGSAKALNTSRVSPVEAWRETEVALPNESWAPSPRTGN